MKGVEMIGKKFGKLTVIKFAGLASNKEYQYECLCECGNKRIASSWNLKNGIAHKCRMCNNQYIDIGNGKTELIIKGVKFIIDTDEVDRVKEYIWCNHGYGYAATNIKGKFLFLHNHILRTPEGKIGDHINGDKKNNTKNNLRPVTWSQNNLNRVKKPGTASIFKGVCWHKQSNKWRAYIYVNGKQKSLGLFDDEVEAAKKYNVEAFKAHGEYIKLNVFKE